MVISSACTPAEEHPARELDMEWRIIVALLCAVALTSAASVDLEDGELKLYLVEIIIIFYIVILVRCEILNRSKNLLFSRSFLPSFPPSLLPSFPPSLLPSFPPSFLLSFFFQKTWKIWWTKWRKTSTGQVSALLYHKKLVIPGQHFI